MRKSFSFGGGSRGRVSKGRGISMAALAFAAPLAVVACANQQQTTEQTVVADAQTTVAALRNTVTALAGQNVLTPAQVAQANTYLADASAVLGALNSSMTATAGASALQKVEADIQAVLGVLAGLPIPAPYSTVIQAANVVLPIIVAYVNQFVANPAPVPASSSAMTPDMARLVLTGAAAK